MKNRDWDRKVWSGNPERTIKDLRWTSSINLKEGLQKFYNWKKKSIENETINYLDLSKWSTLDSEQIKNPITTSIVLIHIHHNMIAPLDGGDDEYPSYHSKHQYVLYYETS